MIHNYLPDFEKAMADNKVLEMFYSVDENNCVTDTTELSDIIDLYLTYFEYPLGFTLYDLLSGKVDSNALKILDSKIYIDELVEKLPVSTQKKNKDKIVKIHNFKDKKI